MKLTKLQRIYIDIGLPKNSFIAFPNDVFKSKEYKEWKKKRRLNIENK